MYILGVVVLLEACDVTNNGRHFWVLPRVEFRLIRLIKVQVFFFALYEK